MEKELLTLPEFQAKYNISRTSLYREVSAGRLRLLKRGKRSLVTREEGERYKKALEEASANISKTRQEAPQAEV